MPALYVKPASALLTSDGGTDGYVSVADSTVFWVGAKVWLSSTTQVSKQYTVIGIEGLCVGLQLVRPAYGGAEYARTGVSEYLVADSAVLSSEGQIVPAETTYAARGYTASNYDKSWTLTGTGSFVVQEFGFWADSQAVTISGADGSVSFDGTDEIPLTLAAISSIAWSDHRRNKIYVKGVGATFTVIASQGAEV